MNTSRLLPALRTWALTACALAMIAPAQAQQMAAAPTPTQLAKYDKNKNGALDADELAAMQADEAKAAGKVEVTKAAEEPKDNEIVELSPFEVNGSEDRGYSASSTLAGTRLNSKLDDIAGSVSVVTKQQLLDTAAVDINDIFQYEVGTEGTKQFTDLTTDSRGDYDNVAGNPTGANRMRGLAQANITAGGFAASSSIPIDTYNIDAVEIVRGPNSNLAGLSDAGGTVNLVTGRANLNRESTNVTARVDSYDGFRTSIDLNRPIIRNVLSGRFSAVYEDKGFQRKPSIDRTNRQQFALTIRPVRSTTINASYERYHEFANRENSIMPREAITYWQANGSPTYDPSTQLITVTKNGVATKTGPITTFTNNLPAGLGLFGSSNVRNLMGIDGGQIQYFMRGGNPSNNAGTPFQLTQAQQPSDSRPLWKLPATTDRSLYDWTSVNLAAPNYETNRADIFNVTLQQSALATQRQRLDVEVAWRREDQLNYRRMFIAQQDGVGNTIAVDTNETLLDGRKNPFFLHPYIGGLAPQVNIRPNFTDQYRAQLAYQIDFRQDKNLLKWLGFHRVLGYEEYRMSITAPSSLRYHDSVVAGPDFVPSITGAINNSNGLLTYPIFYLGSSPRVEYANTGPVNWKDTISASYPIATSGVGTAAWKPTSATLDEVYFSQGLQKKKVRSAGLSIQSFLVDDRVIPTFGWRKDRVYTEDSFSLPTLNGFADLTNLRNFGLNKRWREGPTKTKGVVVKPLRGFDFIRRATESGSGIARFLGEFAQGFQLHYNQSDSFQPADTAYNVFLEQLPNPQGTTKEYGFGLNMYDGKLNLRVTHFDTTQFHSRTGIGTIATRAMAMDFDVPGQNLTFDLYTTATGWQQTLHPEYTLDQAQAAAAKQIGYSVDYINSASGKSISDVLDATSKGTEVELQFNPTRNFTLKLTGGQQIAIDDHVSLFIQELIDQRLPYWTTVTDPAGVPWWTTRLGSTGVPRDYFTGNVQAPLNLAITTQGKRKPQTREYTFKATTKYDLTGFAGDHKWLRGLSVGGSLRWASKAAIGYYAAAPESDGVIRSLDKTRPYYDKPTTNIDLLATYSTRLFRNKIRTTFQFNVANVTEDGHLQGVAVNPDGIFWNYRIIDPRQFIFTTRFDL